MRDGWIRVGAAAPEAAVADVYARADAAAKCAKEAASRGISLLVMPRMALAASEIGDLSCQQTLLSAARDALSGYIRETAQLSMLTLLSLPVRVDGRVHSAVAAVSGGALLALVTERRTAVRTVRFAGFEVPFGSDILLRCTEMPSLCVGIVPGDDLDLPAPASFRLAAAGATVLACPSAQPELAGARERRVQAVCAETSRLRAAYVYAAAGEGESGTDMVFSGRHMIAECGALLCEGAPYAGATLTHAVIDTERILFERSRLAWDTDCGLETVCFSLALRETALDKPKTKNPFLPLTERERETRCREIFELAARGLAARMERARAQTLVLGVSGGLDSTLALLVAARAAALRELPATAVHAVTMPCFGTTARTRTSAERLAGALGARLDTVDIRASVMQHFSDIGHDPDHHSVVYENAQARERTQVLMDLANGEGGLVVGTGDLSELALGWATYNGDHMSMYGVNAGIPKTLLCYIVSCIADLCERDGRAELSAVLRDVLNTPVSPELLPPKDGEIAQCTEGIVGPYELHDFFLYHMLGHGYAPHKILRLAAVAFGDEFGEDEIRAWLGVFLRRFFSQQFKRSCLPDGVRVGSVSLSPRGGLAMPSDASAALWLADLEHAPVYRKDGTSIG